MSIAYRTLTIEKDEVVEIGTYDTLEAAVADTREMWMEDHSPCLIVVEQWPSRNPVATLARVAGDPELCITCYLQEFRMEAHRCHYVLNDLGGYERTEVSEIEYAPQDWRKGAGSRSPREPARYPLTSRNDTPEESIPMANMTDAQARVKAGYAGSYPIEAPETEATYQPTAEDWADYAASRDTEPFAVWISEQAQLYQAQRTERGDWLASQLCDLAAMARRHQASTPNEFDARQEIAERDACGR